MGIEPVFQAMQDKKTGWLIVFAIAAIVLNSIAPLHLKCDTRAIVDAAAAVLLLLSIAVVVIRKPRQRSLARQNISCWQVLFNC